MPIRKVGNLPYHHANRDIICLPFHGELMTFTWNYPMKEFLKIAPLAVSDAYNFVKDEKGELGDIFISEFHNEPKILWFYSHNYGDKNYRLETIEAALENIREQSIPWEHSMAFPCLGYYQEDGINQTDVISLVNEHLGDAPMTIDLFVNY